MQSSEIQRLASAFAYSSRANGKTALLESMLRLNTASMSLELSTEDIEFLVGKLNTSDPNFGGQLTAQDNLPADAAVSFNSRTLINSFKALKAISSGKHPQDLSADLRSALEAIVRATGRPSILIRDGQLASIPEEWEQLALTFHSEQIQSAISSVGRIELDGHPERIRFAGTGWMAGEDVLITNRHVAELFGVKDGRMWRFQANIAANVNFLGEEGSQTTKSFSITAIIAVHKNPAVDLALLRCKKVGAHGEKLPSPISLESRLVPEKEGTRVYTIGYPGFDMRHGEIENELFKGIFNRKRFAPGEVMSTDPAQFRIEHDCSTLRGSSGSCLVSLDTHRVLGLHYAGAPSVANRAVWLPTLKDDPLICDASLNFK